MNNNSQKLNILSIDTQKIISGGKDVKISEMNNDNLSSNMEYK